MEGRGGVCGTVRKEVRLEHSNERIKKQQKNQRGNGRRKQAR